MRVLYNEKCHKGISKTHKCHMIVAKVNILTHKFGFILKSYNVILFVAVSVKHVNAQCECFFKIKNPRSIINLQAINSRWQNCIDFMSTTANSTIPMI